jgi:hypothetical protein
VEETGMTIFHDEQHDTVTVYHHNQRVGSLPAMFDPLNIASTTFLYEPRPTDFTLAGDRWIADPMMGMGDIEAVRGFIPEGWDG